MVINKSDTVRGYIDDKDWNESPTQISFKRDLKQNEEIITSDQALAFYIAAEKKLYESHRLRLLLVTNDIYAFVPDTYLEQTLFLENIYKDQTVSLFRGKSPNDHRERFFVQKKEVFQELINFKYNKIKEGQQYAVEVAEYKDQLTQLTADAPEFLISSPAYFANSLIRHLSLYNENLTGTKTLQKSIDRKIAVFVGVGVGVERLNSYDLNRKESYLTGGMTLRVNMPRNNQNAYIKLNYFLIPGMYYYNFFMAKGEPRMGKAWEAMVGSYLGRSKVQPFFSIGLGHYSIKPPKEIYTPAFSYTILQPSAGISYKKRLELEVAHFSRLFFKMREETPFFIPPRISLNYYLKIK
ncbi:hypothetical protein C5O19_02760 [Siphonobacter curvatus]|uniref:Outer membrane protein beta-barrel domain-containing protein n=1 Tax=Siphonobacter curvatus TaxID=2094562 RepID=A0A2S7ILJ8_9BACT|nr:hypothetical protein C5O19_02760 [Siphonobacter curvatus]